jgi:hypothetical protein
LMHSRWFASADSGVCSSPIKASKSFNVGADLPFDQPKPLLELWILVSALSHAPPPLVPVRGSATGPLEILTFISVPPALLPPCLQFPSCINYALGKPDESLFARPGSLATREGLAPIRATWSAISPPRLRRPAEIVRSPAGS